MRKIATLAAVLVLAGAAAPVDAAQKPGRLTSFTSCSDLVKYARLNGTRTVGPWGFGGPSLAVTTVGAPAAEQKAGADTATEFSGTNVQEAGVDEPDIVKTDGRRIVAIAQGKLRYVDVTGARPRLRDSLDLNDSFAHELLVEGDRALVISRSGGGIVPLPSIRLAPDYVEKTVLTEVDLGSPGALRVVRTLTVEGGYLTARQVGSTARVVLRTFPEVKIEPPPGGSKDDLRAAEERNEKTVARAGLAAWLPRYELRTRKTGRVKRAFLTNCRSVSRPARFSGLGLVTVLTLDLSKGIEPVDSDAVMSNGEIVYASTENLYVATQTWVDPEVVDADRVPPKVETALHGFAAPAAPRTSYRTSGKVSGYLLNQWSLSEHDGALRVASTTMPLWWPTDGQREESESMVTVLEPRAGSLVQAGRVGGLGKGERIYGVRFIGDVGYVVTFRQVDPLYTIDLSQPAKPVVRGELKILGYSAYLHPVGEDLLLGIGQDATAEGRAQGTQVSLFDVSDLRRPARLDRLTIAGASSEAEFDHHAFLYWPKTRLAVLPIVVYAQEGRSAPEVGALGVRVSRAGGVARAGKLEHQATAPIRRSLVVGDTLYTLSDAGLKASDLGSFADRAWVSF